MFTPIVGALLGMMCQSVAAPPQGTTQPVVTYHIVPLPPDPGVLRKTYTREQLALVEKLNRRDVEHLGRADPPVPGLIVPLTWEADERVYSPMPASFSWAEPHARAIVVHQPWQVFGAYEFGLLVRWGPVSSGRKETPTPSGSFNLTWRSKGRHSTDNAAWFLPWYFNFHNERGVSFHQFDLPGYPASHACVRLLERDAMWLYEWGEQWTLEADTRRIATPGTPVLIIGTYVYAARPPWVDLANLVQPLALDHQR
jgi:L,D-transpeptidase-like protein